MKNITNFKCRKFLAFDFTSQIHLYFFVAPDMYILKLN